VRTLLECGIQGFKNQNVPLWHWLNEYQKPKNDPHYLSFLAAVGNEKQQSNAIRLLALLNQPLCDYNEYITREFTIRAWLSEDENSVVFSAGIAFLRQHGTAVDVQLLEGYFAEFTSRKKGAVGQAIVAITAHTGEAKAIECALKLNIDEIDDHLGLILFSNPSSLRTDLLIESLASAASGIRRRAAKILFERRELNSDVAGTLLSDPNYTVRYYAAESLKVSGNELSEALAKKVLTADKKTSGISSIILGETDTIHYERYCLNRLLDKDVSNLMEAFENGDIFSQNETKALLIGHTRQVQKILRINLKDKFEKYFRDRLERFESEVGVDSNLTQQVKNLIPNMSRELIHVGVEALASLRTASDLALVRSIVDADEIYFSEALLSYFTKFGDWTDLDRIIKIKGFRHPSTNVSLLAPERTSVHKAVAIISISRKRLADLLSLDLEVSVRRAVLIELSNSDITSLGDDNIIQGLNHIDEESRALLALKCSRYLPKSRLKKLLDMYINLDGQRFYNSIHWLDLGTSVPRRTAQSIAQLELVSRS